jgi:hypothetical protein
MRPFIVIAAFLSFSTPAFTALAQASTDGGEPAAEPPPRGGLARLQRGAETAMRTSHLALRLEATDDLITDERNPDEEQSVVLAFAPRVSFIDSGAHWLFAEAQLRTRGRLDRNSEKDPDGLGDLPLWVGYQLALTRCPEAGAIRVGPRLGVTLPTSEASSKDGLDPRTTVALESTAHLPLREGRWLNGLFLRGVAAWRHTFSKDVGGPGDTLPGEAPGAAPTRYALSFQYELNLVDELSLRNRWGMTWDVKDAANDYDCQFSLPPMCGPSASSPNSSTAPTTSTTFDLSLGYVLSGLALFEVGYENTAPQVGEDGENRSVFHSTGAKVFVSTTLLLDELFLAQRRATEEGAAGD